MNSSGTIRSFCFALLLALVFVGYPFVSGVGGALGVYSRELSIVMRAVVAALSVGFILLWVLTLPARRWADGPLWVMFAFWLALMARFAWDSSLAPIPMNLPWFENLLLILGVSLLPALALTHTPGSQSLEDGRRWLLLLGAAGGVCVIYTFASLFIGGDTVAKISRLSTEALNPISAGHLGVSLVAVSVFASAPSGGGAIVRFVDSRFVRALVGLLGTGLAVASNSKGPLLALIAVTFAWVVSRALRGGDTKTLLRAIVVLCVVLVLIVAFGIAASSILGFGIFDRFETLGSDRSTSERMLLWRHAIAQFESSPLLGDAFAENVTKFYTHNMIIDTLMTTGVVGFILYVFLTIFGSVAAWRVLRTPHSWISLLYVQFMIASMFSGSAYFDAPYWAITALVLATDRQLHPRVMEEKSFPDAVHLAV